MLEGTGPRAPHEAVAVCGVVLLVLMTGCIGMLDLSSDPASPEKPDPVTGANVADFVTDRARADLLEKYSGGRIDCEAGRHLSVDGGHYVLVECDVTKTSDRTVIDAFPSGAYYVDNETTRGVWHDSESTRYPPESIFGENDSDARSAADTVRLHNFGNTSVDISIQLTYLDSAKAVEAFEGRYELSPQSSVGQIQPIAKPGSYRVVVSSSDGATAAARWTLSDERPSDERALYIYRGPGGTLTVAPGPFDDFDSISRTDREEDAGR